MPLQVLREVDGIRKDRSAGATQLASRSISLVKGASRTVQCDTPYEYLREIADLCVLLASSRPTMGVIANSTALLFHRILQRWKGLSLAELRQASAQEARELLSQMASSAGEASRQAFRVVKRGKTVATHSYSSTVLDALRGSRSKGVKVIASESRPLYEGRRTATQLLEANIPVTLVTDASLPYHLKDADLVMVGADTIFSDGWLANKIGTYPLALAAREAEIPFYVVSESLKLSFRSHRDAHLEEMGADELGDLSKLRGVQARNVYFDLTPPKLITSIVTEDGRLTARKSRSQIDMFRKFYSEMISFKGTGSRRTSL